MARWNPYQFPENKIILEGRKSPGLADVAGAGTPRNWEERKGYGLSGATLWFTGHGLANFTVKLRFYEVSDWEDWHDWKDIVKRAPFGKLPKAKDIYHPLLADLDINRVVVTDVRQAEQIDDGVWEVPIDFRQHRALKHTLAKPKGSNDKPPADPWEQKIQELTDKNNAQSAALAEQLSKYPNLKRITQ